jgi:uncharacterized peroxidase-related enzyme
MLRLLSLSNKELPNVPHPDPLPRSRHGRNCRSVCPDQEVGRQCPAHGPAALQAVLNADAVLAASSLTKQDQEIIKLVVSAVAGCEYCVAAHSLLGKMAGLPPDVLKSLRDAQPTGDEKRDALARFVTVLTKTRGTIPEAEFTAIKRAGYTDAQLVEISLAIAVTVFTNVFNRINDTTIDFPAIH